MNHVPKNALRIDGSHAAKRAPFERPVWYLTRRGIIVLSPCQVMLDGKLSSRPEGKRKIIAKLGAYKVRRGKRPAPSVSLTQQVTE